MEQTNERDIGLDLLRLICLLGIIVIHLCGNAWHDLDVNSFAWQSVNFYDSLFRLSVPCFVMISGALMLSPKRTLSMRELFLKRVPRLLTAWFLWSFLYAARFLIQFLLGAGPEALASFWNALINGHYHLWFMPMIIGLYLVLPLLRSIAADRSLLRYYLILSFVVTILVPTITLVDAFSAPIQDFIDRFMLYLPLGYSFYFMLGYDLVAYPLSGGRKRLLYLAGLLSLFIIIFGTYLGNRSDASLGIRLYDYMTLFVSLTSAAAFVLVRSLVEKKNWSPRLQSFFKLNTRLAFGIYLVHDFFNILFPHFGIFVTSLAPILKIPLLAAVTYAGSFCISLVLSKIPFMRDWLI